MQVIKCSVCEGKTTKDPEPATVETGICGDCRSTLGIVPMGLPKRPALPCTRCNCMTFIRVIPREYTELERADYTSPIAVAMTATQSPRIAQGLFGARTPSADAREGHGRLEMYICQGCGFVEWYCREPNEIPIGAVYMTELLDYAGPSAYR
ncbi:MAG: hypothetical protein M4D80_22235 [Myxococcota bacterium]|nr:hypothetical protein [Myxococcota bacterium]